ncbi:hypothetical protein [Fodinibius salsisoli]|nr:hypothetical protein [Fodinibius salsisoli]
MKYPLGIRLLFGFIIVLTISGLMLNVSFGEPLSAILSWLFPTAVVLTIGFLLARWGQKKRESYHNTFSSGGENPHS